MTDLFFATYEPALLASAWKMHVGLIKVGYAYSVNWLAAQHDTWVANLPLQLVAIPIAIRANMGISA